VADYYTACRLLHLGDRLLRAKMVTQSAIVTEVGEDKDTSFHNSQGLELTQFGTIAAESTSFQVNLRERQLNLDCTLDIGLQKQMSVRLFDIAVCQ
jgi:hypothetical protein